MRLHLFSLRASLLIYTGTKKKCYESSTILIYLMLELFSPKINITSLIYCSSKYIIFMWRSLLNHTLGWRKSKYFFSIQYWMTSLIVFDASPLGLIKVYKDKKVTWFWEIWSWNMEIESIHGRNFYLLFKLTLVNEMDNCVTFSLAVKWWSIHIKTEKLFMMKFMCWFFMGIFCYLWFYFFSP